MESTSMEAEGMRLRDLANLAIGTPEVGAVNFTALHTLLHAILQHLHLQDMSAEPPARRRPPSVGIQGREDGLERRIRHLEKQLGALNNLPSGAELMERSKCGEQGGSSAVRDMWQMMQLERRLEGNEEGVWKAMTVLQDLMMEVNTLKDSQREVQDQIQKVAETTGLKKLEEKLEILHETLARRPESKDTQTSFTSQPSDNDISPVSEPIQGTELSQPNGHLLGTSQTTQSRTQGSNQLEESALPMETPHVTPDGMTVSALEDTQMGVSGQQHERDLTHAHPGAPVPQNTGINPSMTSIDTTAISGSPGVLYTRVDTLEKVKADRTELGLLQRNTDDLAMSLRDLQEKLSNLSREMQHFRVDTDKLERLQRAMDPTGTSQHSDQKLEETSLSAAMQGIDKEQKEMRKRQKHEKATMKQSAADEPLYKQDQDVEVIGHIQKTMLQLQEACERLTRTTGSLIQDCEQKQLHIDILYQTAEILDKNKVDKELIGMEIDVEADNLESKVSRALFDATTEHLSRMIQELLGKVGAQEQDWQRLLEKINVEMQNKLDRVELEPLKNILEQCWRDLRRQLQEHPPQYEADGAAGIRNHDWRSCRSLKTVNQGQGEAAAHKCQPHVAEMRTFLKMVLGNNTRDTPLKTEGLSLPYPALSEGSITELVENARAYPAALVPSANLTLNRRIYRMDNARILHQTEYFFIIIFLQLISRFHCISCDRIVDMMVPGSEILTIPNLPSLPAHHSNRPYTVFELDQVRQQSRSDRLPQLSDSGYTSSFRSCGGSHTLTFPQRRYARLQASTPCTVQKEDFVGDSKPEVFILGHDGNIYRGRRDNNLPTIRTKDGKKSMAAHQKACDCNFKGEDNFSGSSSDINFGVSKAYMKSTLGSEQPLPSIGNSIPPTCYQSAKYT